MEPPRPPRPNPTHADAASGSHKQLPFDQLVATLFQPWTPHDSLSSPSPSPPRNSPPCAAADVPPPPLSAPPPRPTATSSVVTHVYRPPTAADEPRARNPRRPAALKASVHATPKPSSCSGPKEVEVMSFAGEPRSTLPRWPMPAPPTPSLQVHPRAEQVEQDAPEAPQVAEEASPEVEEAGSFPGAEGDSGDGLDGVPPAALGGAAQEILGSAPESSRSQTRGSMTLRVREGNDDDQSADSMHDNDANF